MTDSNKPLTNLASPSRNTPETHQRGAEKLSRIPVKVTPTTEILRKPRWIRAKAPTGKGVNHIKKILRDKKLSSVCEEAACPNLGECFSHGTATFMIMGEICTRRCPFCDVAHGRPNPLDPDEPIGLARAIATRPEILFFDEPWFTTACELVTLGLAMGVAVTTYRVFPFDFSASASDWSTIVRWIIILTIAAMAIALVVNAVKLVTIIVQTLSDTDRAS